MPAPPKPKFQSAWTFTPIDGTKPGVTEGGENESGGFAPHTSREKQREVRTESSKEIPTVEIGDYTIQKKKLPYPLSQKRKKRI